MKRIPLISLLFFSTCHWAPSFAETPPSPTVSVNTCADRNKVVEKLKSKFKEQQERVGLSAKQTLIEIWANEETGTFTILEISPSGKACLLTSGGMWITTEGQPLGESL